MSKSKWIVLHDPSNNVELRVRLDSIEMVSHSDLHMSTVVYTTTYCRSVSESIDEVFALMGNEDG